MSLLLRIGILFCFLSNLFAPAVYAEKLPYMNQSKIRIMVSPGERAFGEMTLTNPTDKPKNMRFYLEDWYYLPGGSGSKEFLPVNSTEFSASSWITFSPAEVIVPAFGKQKISYVINAPKDATGARFSSLFFETKIAESVLSDTGRSVGMDIAVRVATLFYVEVKGTAERKAEISNLKIGPSAKNDGSLEFALDFENTGNTDITTLGNFSLMNSDGLVSARGAFNDLYTFPGGKGILLGIWQGKIMPGVYDFIITVDLGKALIDAGMGRGPVITKEASVTIGENNKIVQIGQLK